MVEERNRRNDITSHHNERTRQQNVSMCGERDETVMHISECEKLPQNEYKKRHGPDDLIIHCERCEIHGF